MSFTKKVLKSFLIMIISATAMLASCSKQISVIPNDYVIHGKEEFPCIPDGYLVISKAKYDNDQELLGLCKESLLNCN